MTSTPTLELITTTTSDPRIVELHRIKDQELAPRYNEHAEATGKTHKFEAGVDSSTTVAVLLMLADGEPAGTVTLRKHDDRYEVKALMVHPDHRGLGIAKKMLTGLEAVARDDGGTRMWLQTGFSQPEAIGLYKKAGWVKLEDPFPPYKDDGVSVFFMKDL